MDLTLTYNPAASDNGTVTGVTNNVDNGRTQNFSYDPLNRISSATSQATSGVDCWGQNFVPDALANLNTISNAQCTNGTLSATVDANNHINTDSTYAYDAPGNMTKDGSGTGWSYAFDAENRLTLATGPSGGPYCYVYDGLGLRVAKKSGTASDCSGGTFVKLYWRSLSGDSLAETDGSGNTQNEYVFFAGRRIASRDGSGHIFYYFADQLGSTRTITTGSGPSQTPGQLCYDADFTPYGQEISYTARLQTTACPPNYKFTGYERDSETGLDYAFARYYSSHLGRFLSTDPLGGAIGDLQSHNAYAYARNNPLNAVDPSGMNDCIGGHYGCQCDPNWDECTNDLLGAKDFIGCAWADFWGGDCAVENRMALNAAGLVSPFDILDLALMPYVIIHISPDGIPEVVPKIIYPFDWLLDYLWYDSTGRGAGNSSGGGGGFLDPVKFSESVLGSIKFQIETNVIAYVCKDKQSTRITTSMRNGAILGAARGAYTGFVSGEAAGGPATFGTSGFAGAAGGAVVGGLAGSIGGFVHGVVAAQVCQSSGWYDY